MAPPVCGDDIPPKIINNAVKPFISIIIEKIGLLNKKTRDVSLHTLISLFRHPQVDIRQLIEGIMDITEKGPTPDKAHLHIVLARLEILLHAVREFGINDKAWDWRIVFEKLVAPSFFNQSHDVRRIAIDVTVELYKKCGAELKRMVQEVDKLKPHLLQEITSRLQHVDQGRGTKYVAGSSDPEGGIGTAQENVVGGLEQVAETNEWSEQSPSGTKYKTNPNFNQQ